MHRATSGAPARYPGQVIAAALERLTRAAEDGRLEVLCRRLDVVLLTVFGSAVRDAASAGDLDVAALFGRRAVMAPLDLVNALVDITGTDAVDLLVLDDADPVARFNATSRGRPFYQDAPTRWGTTQMGYATMLFDTEHLRRAELEGLASR